MSNRILLVEDEAIIALNEAQIIKKYGYEVSTVYNGEDAIEKVDEDPELNLILMDIDLGRGIDGTEAAKRILERHELPIVFLTGHSEKEYVDMVKKITGYGYVLKNSGEFILIETIEMAFRLYGAQIELKRQKENLQNALIRQERSEEKLQVYSERYQQLFENIGSCVAVYEPIENAEDFVFVDFNKSAEKTEKIRKEEVIGRKVTEVFPSVEEFGLFETLKRVAKHGKPEHLPESQYTDDRIVGWRENYVYKLPSGEIVAVYEDLTEQKRLDQKLEENEEDLRITLNSIGDAVVATDIHGRIVRMNPVGENLTGWAENDAQNKLLDEVFYIINAETREIVDNPVEKVIRTGNVVGLANHTVLLSREGFEYQIADSAAPIRDDDGNINGVVLVFRDVSEKYKKERQLKESEEKYKSLFNNSPVTITIHDKVTGELVDANEEAYTSYGYTSLSELKENDFWMDPPYSFNEALEWIHKAANEGIQKFEWKNRNVTGEIFWEYVTLRPVTINGIERVMSTAVDISEQKTTEEILQKKTDFLNNLLVNISDMVVLSDVDGHITFYSNLYETLGYGQDALIGKNVLEFVHPEDSEEVGSKLNEFIENREDKRRIECRVRCADGCYLWMETDAKTIKDKSGDIQELLLSTRDITKRKETEKELEYEKAFLNTVLDNIKEAIVICDKEGKLIRFNEAARRLHGIPEKPIPPEKWAENYDLFYSDGVTPLAPEDNPLFRALKGKEVQNHEMLVSPENQSPRILSCNGRQLIDNKREVIGAAIAMYDITEYKETERSLHNAVEEKNMLMQELNHRVKNNLSMVSSLIRLKNSALGDTIDLSDIKYQIDAIQTVHEKLSQTEDLTHIELRSYLESILKSLFSNYSSLNVVIDNKIEDIELPTKHAVPLALITNEIATNAVKYGFVESEKAVFTVTFYKDTSEKQYIFILSNSGNPFPEDIDFSSSDTLGLELINAIVTQLRGSIELRKKPNPQFTIRFPIERK